MNYFRVVQEFGRIPQWLTFRSASTGISEEHLTVLVIDGLEVPSKNGGLSMDDLDHSGTKPLSC